MITSVPSGHARLAILAGVGIAAASVLWPRPTSAQLDLNGLWRVGVFVTQLSGTFSDVCSLNIVQTGSALSIGGPCEGRANPVEIIGTIDLSTGRFTGSGSAGDCSAATISGTVAPDATRFTGEFSCPGSGAGGGLTANRCGNGQIDPGESCDDGNIAEGDCCTSDCRREAAGTPCTDDGTQCTTDTCGAAGECEHATRSGSCSDLNQCTSGDTCLEGQCVSTTIRPDGSACDDGNACTTADRCVGGICRTEPVACPSCQSCNTVLGCVPTITTGCKESAASAIVLRRLGSDALLWQWQRGDATQSAELGDPTLATDYDFCVYDASADRGSPGLLVSARAPAGSNWHTTAGGFGYDSDDLAPDGLQTIRFKTGAAGLSRVTVKGQGPNLALPALQSVASPITVQLKSRDGVRSQCWSAVFRQPAIRTSRMFRAGRAIRRPRDRPNILVISLDDTRADGIARMPTLAQLASEGVTFTNSFAVDPLCAPSRASLLTGLYAGHHGARALGGVIGGAGVFRELGADRQTIGVWLQAAGYMTGLFGKYVNGYGFGPEQQRGPDGTYYVPPGWTRWRGMTSPEHFGGIRGPTYTVVDERGAPTVYADHTTDRQYSTDLLAAQLRAFIADAAGQHRPFFAVWTPYASHADLPLFLPEPAARHFGFFRGLPPWQPASWGEIDVTDKPRWVQGLPPADIVPAVLTELIRTAAYETLLAVDEQLHVIRDDLVQLGIERNTVILLTSDNGVGWGEHRIFYQAKECPYEECLRVPMIVYDPRAGGGAVMQDATVLNIDVAPTVAELAGVLPPVPTDGVSFAPWLAGTPPAPWRDDFLIEHWRTTRGETLGYTGQVSDGDQLRILYGDVRARPRAALLCEFDNDGAVATGARAVPIGSDADATFATFSNVVAAALPFAATLHVPSTDRVQLTDTSPDHAGLYLVVERDLRSVIEHTYIAADFFGVRDVTNGLTYVEHESGEIELYDLTADPALLENKADDPAYADTRGRLAQRLEELLR